MDMVELGAKIDALKTELEQVQSRFESVGNRFISVWGEIERIVKNTNIDIYELRQRIRALEIRR